MIAALAAGCRDRDDTGQEADEPDPEPTRAGQGEREPPPLPEAAELPEDPGEHDGDIAWAIRFGGPERAAARGIAALGDGAVAVGYVSESAQIGDATHESDGIDAYATRIDAEGEHVWTRFFGGRGDDIANSVAVTESGNVVIAGAFAHELEVGDESLAGAGADNIFVVKLSPEGERLWARSFGGHDIDAAHYVSAGPGGRIYVTGVFRDTVSFGEHTLESEGDADIFALALSSDGEPIWARGFGARGPDYGRAIVPHPRGVALLAEFSLEVEFGDTALQSAGNRDLVVTLLDPDGEPIWARGFGGFYNEVGVDLAVDPAGDLIATGSFDDEVDFGGGALTSAGQSDAFLLKLDSDGDHLWSRHVGGEEEDIGSSVATDRYGNVVAAGWFWYEIEFDDTTLESAGRRDGYVAKLSPDGEPLWAHSFGGELGDMARSVAIADNGNVFVAGTFHGTAEFGQIELTAAGAEAEVPRGDAFVVMLEP